MSDSAQLHKIAVSASVASDNTVRPKVMRRPAQFSPTSASPTITSQALVLAMDPPAEKPARSPAWQDDMRFAIALLAIIIFVNLAVMFWLSRMPAQTPEVTRITQSTNSDDPAAPTQEITIFSPTASEDADDDVDGAAPVNILDDRHSRPLQ